MSDYKESSLKRRDIRSGSLNDRAEDNKLGKHKPKARKGNIVVETINHFGNGNWCKYKLFESEQKAKDYVELMNAKERRRLSVTEEVEDFYTDRFRIKPKSSF